MTSAPASVSHCYHHPSARSLTGSLRRHFIVEPRESAPLQHPGFYLWAVDDHLELRRGGEPAGVWISVDDVARRSAQGGELRRACLGKAGSANVLDAMAGWGVDGLVLAGAGATVTLVERQPALWALQRDLVRRTGLDRVVCRCDDGFAAITGSEAHDVIYLDPMFPTRNKRALPGKRMQWTAQLATADPRPLAQWLDAAIGRAVERVVLKRRRKDPALRPPDWQIVGTTVRYDVYRGRAEHAR